MRRRQILNGATEAPPPRPTAPPAPPPVVKEVTPWKARPPHPVKGHCRWCGVYVGRGKGVHERFCDAQLEASNEHVWNPKEENLSGDEAR